MGEGHRTHGLPTDIGQCVAFFQNRTIKPKATFNPDTVQGEFTQNLSVDNTSVDLNAVIITRFKPRALRIFTDGPTQISHGLEDGTDQAFIG
jgi:hypothetical protein